MKKKINILAVFLIIIVSIGITNKEFQNDTFYIIKVGESILKNGVDMIDHFSIHNIPYFYEHWLHDLLVYFIYSKFGFTGLYISNILFASVLGFVIYFSTKKLYHNDYLSLFFTVIVLFLMRNFIATRAQLISYIIFALEMYFLEMLTRTGKKKYIIFLFFGSLICANVHSAVWPMYLVLFLPYFASSLLIKYYKSGFKISKLKINKHSNTWLFNCSKNNDKSIIIKSECRYINVLIIAFLLCVLSGFFNLNHNQCFTHFIYLKMGTTLNHIGEHQPIVLYDNPDFFLYLTILLILFYKSKEKISIKNILLLGGLFFLTICSYRHLALFLIVGVYPIIEYFSKYEFKSKLYKQKIVLFFLVFSVCISCFQFYINFNKKYIFNEYPIDAAKYINDKINKDDMVLFNDYNYGSYLIFNNIKVFIDSRASLYTKQFNNLKYDIYEDWNLVCSTGKYKKVFDRYKINHILTKKNSILDYSLKSDYKYERIYSDKNYVIYKYNN